MNCRLCPAPITRRNVSGLCRSCSAKNRAPGTPKGARVANCADCETPICRNKTGRCKRCATIYWNSLPETKEKRRQSWARQLKNPFVRRRLAAVVRENFAKAMADPEKRKAAQDRGRRLYETHLCTPEVQEKIRASRPQAARKIRATRLPWCPEEMWDEYRFLTYHKHFPPAEAKELVLAEYQRRIDALSPFERQMRALENGAQLVANDTSPSLANPGDYGERKWA